MVHNSNLLFKKMYCHLSEILHDQLFQEHLTDKLLYLSIQKSSREISIRYKFKF